MKSNESVKIVFLKIVFCYITALQNKIDKLVTPISDSWRVGNVHNSPSTLVKKTRRRKSTNQCADHLDLSTDFDPVPGVNDFLNQAC